MEKFPYKEFYENQASWLDKKDENIFASIVENTTSTVIWSLNFDEAIFVMKVSRIVLVI